MSKTFTFRVPRIVQMKQLLEFDVVADNVGEAEHKAFIAGHEYPLINAPAIKGAVVLKADIIEVEDIERPKIVTRKKP